MAKLPIRLAGIAQPQIGGPQSQASTSFGKGMQQLGAGISDAAISQSKINERKKAEDREIDLHAQVIAAGRMLEITKEDALYNNADGKGGQQEYGEKSQKVLSHFSEGRDEAWTKEFKDRLLGKDNDERRQVETVGRSKDLQATYDILDEEKSLFLNKIRKDPDTLESELDSHMGLGYAIFKRSDIPKDQQENYHKALRHEAKQVALLGEIDKGYEGSEDALEKLDSKEYQSEFSVGEVKDLENRAHNMMNNIVIQNRAVMDSIIGSVEALEAQNMPTGAISNEYIQMALDKHLPEKEAKAAGIRIKNAVNKGDIFREIANLLSEQIETD